MVMTSDNDANHKGRLKDPERQLIVIGLMSGTSMDGIDVALIETDGVSIEKCGAFATYPYSASLRERLNVACGRDPRSHGLELELVEDVTDAHIEAVKAFAHTAGIDLADLDLVGFHGQTVFHDPSSGFTCQLGDGARMARALGVPVVNDFRSADVAAGGEGAPFAPLYHAARSFDLEKPLCVLNLGGVGNLTWISADGGIIAFDTGPANALLDDWVYEHTVERFDADGAAARGGRVIRPVLDALLENSYFKAPYPKSLDRDHFSLEPVRDLSFEDGAATLVSFTAESVRLAQELLPARPFSWLVTGGGRRNPVMMAALRERLDGSVDPVEIAGWSGDALEAQAFGYLAVRSVRGWPLSLPTTTGVPEPTTGGVLSLTG